MANNEKDNAEDLMPSMAPGIGFTNDEDEEDNSFVDRLMNFGEGYFDFDSYNDLFGKEEK